MVSKITDYYFIITDYQLLLTNTFKILQKPITSQIYNFFPTKNKKIPLQVTTGLNFI